MLIKFVYAIYVKHVEPSVPVPSSPFLLAKQQTRGTPLQLRVANRHVDNLTNL